MSVVLALETSCDETAAAVLCGLKDVAADVVYSQVDRHALHGGVVPEIASRSHLEVLPDVICQALQQARLDIDSVDAFAATTGPGLAPALMVGANAGRGLAAGSGKSLHGINHLEGHLLSPFFGSQTIPPHCGLVVSGGHTLLFHVRGFRDYELLGRTLDDAAGEAFDKVAKLLGLGYPGGAEVSRLAERGNPDKFRFPRAMLDSGDFQFSFSGLKTSVRTFLQNGFHEEDLPDICAGFQEAVVDVLAGKLRMAVKKNGCKLAALSGGVSANRRLAMRCREVLEPEGVELRVAGDALRTDNALMIAYVAALEIDAGLQPGNAPDVSPHFQPETFPF